MADFRTLTLKERLERFPPFLCVALSRVPVEPMTLVEKTKRLWNRRERARRRHLKRNGESLPRRSRWRRLTFKELAEAGHIPIGTFEKLAVQTDWNHVSVFTMLRFLSACGVDLLRMRSHHCFLRDNLSKERAFQHLTTQQMQRFVRLARKWKAAT